MSVSVEAPEGHLVISGPLVVLRRFLWSVGYILPAPDDDESLDWLPDGDEPLRLRR